MPQGLHAATGSDSPCLNASPYYKVVIDTADESRIQWNKATLVTVLLVDG
jgi:hypothetical protein